MTSENVTVLFTDMVGSTALASSLAPEAADDLRREHFAMLRQSLVERAAPGDAALARHLLGAAQTVAIANGYARLARQAADALRQPA